MLSISEYFRRSAHLISALLFDPPACLLCGEVFQIAFRHKREQQLCARCEIFFASLNPIKTTLLGDDYDLPSLTCFSGGFYDGPLQEAIYQIKYLKKIDLAASVAQVLLPAAVALLDQCDLPKQQILLVPVPLHREKLKERGFNQAVELAEPLARAIDSQVLACRGEYRGLKRIRLTAPQFGLSRGQRRVNLDGAFRAESRWLKGQAVIIIDDVVTSGATIYECARAVSAAGGNVIGGVTLARARWQTSLYTTDNADGHANHSTVIPKLARS